MEPPSIPDNRAHKRHFAMSSTPNIVDPDDFVAQFKASAHHHSRSHSPGQAYEPLAFGQPAIGRPPMRPQGRSMSRLSTNGIPNSIYNGEKFGRNPSIDQESVTDSVATLDLGYHTIGQPLPQRRRQSSTSTGYQSFDQRSLRTISLDQQSIGTQPLGYYSTDALPGGYLP
jgi:hypothetical protein